MPNRRTHTLTGFTVGTLLVSFNEIRKVRDLKKLRFKDYLTIGAKAVLGGVITASGAMLPDILEPATSPFHRKFFHSYTLMIALALALLFTSKDGFLTDKLEDLLLKNVGLGYFIHLVQDSLTPMSLPII